MARRTNTTSAHCRLIAIDGTIHSLKAIPTSKAMHPSREVGCFDNGESLVAVGVIANVRAICPSPFFSSAALRRRKKQTRNMALVAASLGPAGMKPTEAKKS